MLSESSRDSAPVPSAARPFWRTELRQAVAAAIDRQALVESAFGTHGSPAYHMVPPGYPYATEPFLDLYGTRNLALSARLLQDLGYSREEPFEFDLWHPPMGHYGVTDEAVLALLKQQLEEHGLMRVNLRSKRWGEYVDSLLAGEMPA